MPAAHGGSAMTAPTSLDQPERRLDGDEKTTGAAKYTADLAVTGALEATFVRSPYPHARIVSVDTARARSLVGAFARAARIFEREFVTPRIHQAALEPRAAVVWVEGDRVRVVSTNKAPFNLRDQMAATLGIAKDRIVVDNGTIGGDFGGKGLSTDEFVLYHLAKATERPVRAVTRYADDLTTTNPRHASRIRLRTGVDADGRIVAHESHALFDGGAYAAGKPTVRLLVEGGVETLEGYRVPAARHEAATVYTNQVPGGHMRAPGQPQNVFASESHLDLIARELGITPLELRRRNVAGDGDPTTTGEVWHGPDLRGLLDRAAAEIGADRP